MFGTLDNVILVEVFISVLSAHVLHVDTCRLQGLEDFLSCVIVIEERTDGVDTVFVEIGNGSWKIADRVQYKAGGGFFSFHCEIGKKVDKTLEETKPFRNISLN